MLSRVELEAILEKHNVMVRDSHVVYTSGLHGSEYFNKDEIYPHTRAVEELCASLAHLLPFASEVEAVIAPVVGGVALSQWTAHALSRYWKTEVLALYADRIPGATSDLDEFVLKRGYDKKASGKRVLAMDDVLTTGKSLKKTIAVARACGAEVIGAAALCNRGGVTINDLGDPPELHSLWNLNLKSFPADACPFCRDKVPINTNVGKGRDFLAKQQTSA